MGNLSSCKWWIELLAAVHRLWPWTHRMEKLMTPTHWSSSKNQTWHQSLFTSGIAPVASCSSWGSSWGNVKVQCHSDIGDRAFNANEHWAMVKINMSKSKVKRCHWSKVPCQCHLSHKRQISHYIFWCIKLYSYTIYIIIYTYIYIIDNIYIIYSYILWWLTNYINS